MNRTKSRQLKIAFCGLAALGMFAAAQGCSSSSTSGSGGSTGAGGNQVGPGGSTGAGGTTTGAGGAVAACATVPAGGKIADFTPDGGATSGLALGTFYATMDTGLTAPTFSTSTGALVINYATGIPTTMYPYVGVGVPFAACANASAFTGIKFNISGTLSAGCTIQFSAIDKEHLTSLNGGLCTGTTGNGCYPSSKAFTLPATATDVTVLFTDQMNGGMDPGTTALDPTKLTGIQWQVNPVGAAAGDAGMGCTGSITIDNVTFL